MTIDHRSSLQVDQMLKMQPRSKKLAGARGAGDETAGQQPGPGQAEQSALEGCDHSEHGDDDAPSSDQKDPLKLAAPASKTAAARAALPKALVRKTRPTAVATHAALLLKPPQDVLKLQGTDILGEKKNVQMSARRASPHR